MKKLACSVSVLFLLVLGCTQNKGMNEMLKVHFPLVTLNLDPHRMEDAFSMTVVLQIYRGLMRYTPSGDVTTDLAESWKESADHKTYTVKLKKATFSNGELITAHHVQMSFARLFSSGAAMGADLDYISGALDFIKSGDLSKLGIIPKSETEIEFRLSHPSALFLKHLAVADSAILPLKSFKDKILFNEKSSFSGPYKITSIDERNVFLEKWREDELDSKNPPKKIHFFTTDKKASELALNNETDSLDHDIIDDTTKKELIKRGWKETATELIAETYVILNPNIVPDNVRSVLFNSINQTDVANLLGSKYVPAFGAIPRGLTGELSSEDMEQIKKAPTKIKAEVSLEYDPKNPIHEKLVSYLQKTWSALGVLVRSTPLEKKELLTRLFGSKCEVCLGQKGLDYPDGYSVLTYFKSGYDANYFHVKDKGIDELVNSAGMILEREAREKRYKKIQKQVLLKHTLVPLVFGSEASGLWSDKIASIPAHVMGFHMMPFEIVEMKGAY